MSKAKERITSNMFESSKDGEAEDIRLVNTEKPTNTEPAATSGEVEAQRVLAEARQSRASACFEAIQRILQMHNCEIVVMQTFVNGQPRPIEIQIAAR